MKAAIAFVAGASALAAAGVLSGFAVPHPPAQDEKALLEEIRWLQSAQWHRQNPQNLKGDCDFTTCIRRHMEEHAKAVADWNTPEARKKRAEDAAAVEAYQKERMDKRHASLFKHPRQEDCEPLSEVGPCKKREAEWIEKKLLEEREKK